MCVDKDSGRQSGTIENQITPEMIEAGKEALIRLQKGGSDPAYVVERVFEEMRRISSIMPTVAPLPGIVDTKNGRIQVSDRGGESNQLGILVERDGLFCGTLLSPAQAHQLARLLLKRNRLRESADT